MAEAVDAAMVVVVDVALFTCLGMVTQSQLLMMKTNQMAFSLMTIKLKTIAV